MPNGPIASQRSRALVAGALVLGLGVVTFAGGCSSDSGTGPAAAEAAAPSKPAPGVPAATAALEAGATVIDVRTPDEYAAGHVDGAKMVNIQDPTFAAEIAELDPEVTYVVYCRSGNRSATAAEEMRAIGLDVLDGGALDDMVAAGWPAATG
jgi:phage shock protein E